MTDDADSAATPAPQPVSLVEAAWRQYADIARRIVDNPKLLIDRAHCEEMARAWGRFIDLYNADQKAN